MGAVLDLDNCGDEIWAESDYRSENVETGLDALGHISQIHERAYRNHPLTEEQIASNREQSKTRSNQGRACLWSLGDDDGGQVGAGDWHRAGAGATGTQEFGVQPQALWVLAKEDAV